MSIQSSDSTSINWVGIVKTSGDEWSYYTKKILLTEKPDFASIRMDSQGICGIYVNGEFLETSCGRYFHRITYVEITSLLQEGQNEILFKLGSHFFQPTGFAVRERRGSWYSAVAAEIEIQHGEHVEKLVTDETWECTSDDGQSVPEVFSQVNYADYQRFWENAVLMREPKKPQIPKEISKLTGDDYVAYANRPWQFWKSPENITDTQNNGVIERIYDFGKLHVGYIQLEYTAECDSEITLLFDFFDTLDDFTEKAQMPWVVERLAIKVPIQKGQHKVQLLRRRACHYIKTEIPSGVSIQDFKFRLSMMTSEQTGWFSSSDKMLNEMWEIGKYTLHVNKHQEYECCPRHEMKYFSGDGSLEALIDYYAFGGKDLTNASISLTEIASNVGIRLDVYNNDWGLWDFVAWRIIMVHNWYRYFNDVETIRQYYDELVTAMEWMIHRAGKDYLIYQFPLWWEPFYCQSDSVEYTCSYDRLGEKPLMNALYYKSLLCMAELSDAMGDERGLKWRQRAAQVHTAFNERLWSEKEEAYLDTYDTSYIPQEGNAMAVLYGLADEDKTKKILETLKRENWTEYGSGILSKEVVHSMGGKAASSPLMVTLEVEARFQSGDSEGGMELMRRFWGYMLERKVGTFWEYTPEVLGRCHGWGGGCTYLIGACIMGIRPAEPGYQKLHFEPYQGLDSFVGVVPTARGLVAVKCTDVSGKKQYELVLPQGTEIETVLPKEAILLVTEYANQQ